jgi:hypothetical protein
MVPLRIVQASMFPISIVSLLIAPLPHCRLSHGLIVPLSNCPLRHCPLSTCPLLTCPLSHCPKSHCPIAPLCPTDPVSQNPIVPLCIVPLACSPISIVPMSHCPLPHGPLCDCPLSRGLFVSLSHCLLHSRPTHPPVRRRFEKPDL